jgi:hypothetical protein
LVHPKANLPSSSHAYRWKSFECLFWTMADLKHSYDNKIHASQDKATYEFERTKSGFG